jgi:hypothetical protein
VTARAARKWQFSDQKHHGYVLVLDCTVADEFAERGAGQSRIACKLLIEQGDNLFSTLVMTEAQRQLSHFTR